MNRIYAYREHWTELEPYVIQFGDREIGWKCNKNELKHLWSVGIRNARSISYGDITLLYKGKVIRSIWNVELPILIKKHNDPTRHGNYECQYHKYTYE